MSDKSRIEELVNDVRALGNCLRFVWEKRLTYIKYSVIGAIVAIVIAFSIPKNYSVSVVLAPEPQSGSSMSGLSSIASFAGVNLGGMGEDAYTVDIYPSIVSSIDFLLSLSEIKVSPDELDGEMTYYEYLLKHTKRPWWEYPVSWLKSLMPKFGSESDSGSASSVGPRRINKQQYAICEKIKGNVGCMVEDLTGVISVTAHDQDPEVAAVIADSVVTRLNRFILDYRTGKARAEYEYMSLLGDSARVRYTAAQDRYVEFARRHTVATSPAVQAQLEFLQNEVSLAYSAYSTLVGQVQIAQSKIQETTPIYTVVEEGYVPLYADSPRKMLILVVVVFFACIIATMKLVYVEFFGKKDCNVEESDT